MANDQYSRIWRTVVFAGAMLGTPAAMAGDAAPPQASKPNPNAGAPATPAKMPVQAKPDAATEKAAKIDTLDAERKTLIGQLLAAEPKDLDKLKKDIVAKDTAIKKLVDEIVNLRRPRPRTPVDVKPVGRGFVLA